MPSESPGPLLRSGPPRSSSAGGSGSSSRHTIEVRVPALPPRGGTTTMKKSSRSRQAKPQDKFSSSSGPLDLVSKPAAVADPFGTYPVPRTLITAPGQPLLAAADRISASNQGEISGGNPLVSILKPAKAVTSGCRPGRILCPSLEVTSVQGAGWSLRIGIGPETHGSPVDIGPHWPPSLGLLPCGLLCPYHRTRLRGIMVSTPRGFRARHSPSLSRSGLSRLLPRSPTQPSTPWPTWRH
jgi:hypothetical protein